LLRDACITPTIFDACDGPTLSEFITRRVTILDGSAIQHCLQQELMSILEQTARTHYERVQNQSVRLFTDTIGAMTYVAIEYNQRGDIKKTMLLADFCRAVLDVGMGVGEGIIDGMSNVTHMIAHPLDTVINTAHGVSTAAYYTGRVLYEICGITKDCLIDFDMGMDRVNRAQANIKAIKGELESKIKKMTPRQIARAVTGVCVEVVLTKKCMSTMHRFYQGAQAQMAVIAQQIERGIHPQLAFAGAGNEVTLAVGAADSLFLIQEGGDALKSAGKKAKKAIDVGKNVSKGGIAKVGTGKKIDWISHGHKHVPPKNLCWKAIVKGTKYGDAVYKPGINIEWLERFAWKHGTQSTKKKAWKIIKFDYPIGANSGSETCCMRVEMSANTIHGHPITLKDFINHTKHIK